MIGVWSLPGSLAVIGRIMTALQRDRVHILHSPRDTAGLCQALQTRIFNDARSPILINGRDPRGFRVTLSACIAAAEAIPMAALAEIESLRSTVIILTTAGILDPDVQTFARIVRRNQDDMGPCLIVITSDGLAQLGDVATEELRDVLGPLDGAAYAAWLPRFEKPLVGQLVASIAIEVAAWDVELLDRLTALPLPQAFRPDEHVAAWSDGREQAWYGVALRWDLGCLDRWAGIDVEHPVWLAANRPRQLQKRVWRGQLATLLPWIENHRLRLVERYDRLLRAENLRDGDTALLDWGPLVLQIRTKDAKRSMAAEQFRIARNELAHGRPLGWSQIRSCMLNSSQLMDAR